MGKTWQKEIKILIKDPRSIIENMKKVTDIPADAIEAIVSQEIGGAFDAWNEQNGGNLG
jgi:hypothetical protein